MFNGEKVNDTRLQDSFNYRKCYKIHSDFLQGFITLQIFLLPILSASAVEIDQDGLSAFTNRSEPENEGKGLAECLRTYEREEVVVYDTVYQKECLNFTIPHCHVTHLQLPQDSTETRLVELNFCSI